MGVAEAPSLAEPPHRTHRHPHPARGSPRLRHHLGPAPAHLHPFQHAQLCRNPDRRRPNDAYQAAVQSAAVTCQDLYRACVGVVEGL